MKKILFFIGFAILSLYGYSQTANLTLKVSNIKEVKGNMSIAIFNSADGFPSSDNFFVGEHIPVKSKDFVYTFKDIPAGKYAIAIYQDINKNGELDKNWFGIPKEPYGFSYKEKGETGSAEFDEATIDLNGDTVIEINLIN